MMNLDRYHVGGINSRGENVFPDATRDPDFFAWWNQFMDENQALVQKFLGWLSECSRVSFSEPGEVVILGEECESNAWENAPGNLLFLFPLGAEDGMDAYERPRVLQFNPEILGIQRKTAQGVLDMIAVGRAH